MNEKADMIEHLPSIEISFGLHLHRVVDSVDCVYLEQVVKTCQRNEYTGLISTCINKISDDSQRFTGVSVGLFAMLTYLNYAFVSCEFNLSAVTTVKPIFKESK